MIGLGARAARPPRRVPPATRRMRKERARRPRPWAGGAAEASVAQTCFPRSAAPYFRCLRWVRYEELGPVVTRKSRQKRAARRIRELRSPLSYEATWRRAPFIGPATFRCLRSLCEERKNLDEEMENRRAWKNEFCAASLLRGFVKATKTTERPQGLRSKPCACWLSRSDMTAC